MAHASYNPLLGLPTSSNCCSMLQNYTCGCVSSGARFSLFWHGWVSHSSFGLSVRRTVRSCSCFSHVQMSTLKADRRFRSAINRSNRIAFDRLLDVVVVVLRMWCRARSNRFTARANRTRHAAAMRAIASSIWADLPISTILFHMELPVDARHNSKIRRAGVLAWVLRNLR